MTALPALTQFRLEIDASGVAHLIFDCPGRTMNVFSEAAITELRLVADWLGDADVRGLLIRSGKDNAFCAGADLTELGVAYDMIVAAPPRARFGLAFEHFFRLSAALRALETAGKPVAAAIAGLALGGGCELALAAHRRFLVDDPKVAMGLPESLVGLLPGAGGTQRLPRLVGLERALPILLDGARLGGADALAAGLADVLVRPGEEVTAAHTWLLSDPTPVQRWDTEEWRAPSAAEVATLVGERRAAVMASTLGHYPAPLAILDCLEFGLPQGFEGAIRSEMATFAELIQREEPRNMIQTMFLAKTEFDRLSRKQALPDGLSAVVQAAREAISREDAGTLAAAGFSVADETGTPVRPTRGYWLDTDEGAAARAAVTRISAEVERRVADLSAQERRLADYAIVREVGFPSYLGGPLTFDERQKRPGL